MFSGFAVASPVYGWFADVPRKLRIGLKTSRPCFPIHELAETLPTPLPLMGAAIVYPSAQVGAKFSR